MPIRLNGSTSGFTELSAPAVAGNNSIALPTGNGNAFQILRNGATAGTTEFTDKIVSGTAVASTSGTSIDFTGIPSWVKRITVMFGGVSVSGTSLMGLRIGTSGGIEATGYRASCGMSTNANQFVSSTTEFPLNTVASNNTTDVLSGAVVLTNLSSNTWVLHGSTDRGPVFGVGAFHGGAKTLSGTLDRIRITTANGTDTFDAGSINILYE